MKLLLYTVIVFLFIVWAVRTLTYNTGKYVYMLLIMAAISALTRKTGNDYNLQKRNRY